MIQSWDVLRQDIAKEFREHPADFLRQPTITRTMHPDQPELAKSYAAELGRTTFGQKLMERAKDALCGKPREHVRGHSMSSLQHAWQLYKLWEYFSLTPSMLKHVSEIGGGYGDMCRQMYAGGGPATYAIFDFPEMHAIQRRYLDSCCVKAQFHAPETFIGGVPGFKSLLLATFSISEMPVEQREQLEPAFAGYDYLVFSWNSHFADVDNGTWFEDLRYRLQNRFQLTTMKDPYMRGWYLFGERR